MNPGTRIDYKTLRKINPEAARQRCQLVLVELGSVSPRRSLRVPRCSSIQSGEGWSLRPVQVKNISTRASTIRSHSSNHQCCRSQPRGDIVAETIPSQ